MRKLIFRAWDESNKIMHYDFQFIKSGNEGNDWIIFTSDKQDLKSNPHPFDNHYFQKQLRIMQYTDLKDITGKNKYCQDDIVRYKNKNYRLIKGTYMFELVGFNESSQDTPSDFFSERAYMNAEIVGNIYENFDLLKQ